MPVAFLGQQETKELRVTEVLKEFRVHKGPRETLAHKVPLVQKVMAALLV